MSYSINVPISSAIVFIPYLLTSLLALAIALSSTSIDAIPKHRQHQIRVISLLISVIGFLATLSQCLVVMSTGKVAVVEILGKVQESPLKPGVHLTNPMAKITSFSTRLKDIKETVSATSKEGLNLSIDVSLQYKLDPQQVANVYENIGTDETEIIISRFRSLIREISARYEAREIYGAKRQEIAQTLQDSLISQLQPLGFTVDQALLRNVTLPDSIQAAIQEKLAAQQESERQEFINEKERQEIEFEIEKAQKEAERQRIEAQGIADAQKLLAQGLTPQIIQLKSIEATQQLAESENSKVIIIGGGKDNLPLILQQSE
nr:prohibitin family protein [Roseofilum sp. Belize Diploria]